MEINTEKAFSKVPEITLMFWLMKIFATTLGETGGDALSMSMNLGYLASTGILAVILAIALRSQIYAKKFTPGIYWFAIISTTTIGTTIADFADRSLGIGYAGGSTLLFCLLIISLIVWKVSTGSVSVNTITSRKPEIFYWVTIMFSQTLGTALGDWIADDAGFEYLGSAIIFGSILLFIAILNYKTNISKTVLFWAAFILTRPLGAVVGDFLDKPLSEGGLDLSRFAASGVLIVFIIIGILFTSRKKQQVRECNSEYNSDF
jgi:uncharacterized membrane-anchored protein